MTSRLPKVGWNALYLVVLVGTAAAIQMPLALNHDAAWHFYTAFRVLAGDRVGIDVFDINPPLAAWLFTFPAWLVLMTGFSPAIVFKTFVLAICTVSWLASRRTLSHQIEYDSAWAPLTIGAALFLLPGYDFGQREHLVAAFTLPYVLLAGVRAEGRIPSRRMAMLVGGAAAVGIGFKPYFLFVPAMVETWLAFTTRSRSTLLRPEPLAMIGIWLVYLSSVAAFAPAYLTTIVPEALHNYSGFQQSWSVVTASTVTTLALPFLALCLSFIKGRERPLSVVSSCLAAALGFLVAALWQCKGWSYQLYPAAMYLMVAAGMNWAGRQRLRRTVAMVPLALASTLALTCMVPTLSFLADGWAPRGTTARVVALTRLFNEHGGYGGYAYAFITSPRDVMPAALEAGKRWADASGVLVFLPALVDEIDNQSRLRPDDAVATIADRADRNIISELKLRRPDVVLVDAGPGKLGMEQSPFQYLPFFMNRYPEFRAIWGNYREASPIGRFRIFILKGGKGRLAGSS